MKPKQSDDSGTVVLVVAPIGKDAALATQVLEQAGIAARACASLGEIAGQLGDATNAIVVAAEGLSASEVSLLLDALAQQPPWSDIPLIVLTSSGGGDAVSLRALEIFGPKANITLLERPLRSVTLISTVQVALRARRRQRQVRDLLEQREMVLTGISDAFAAFDRDWRYIYVNEKAAEYAGMSREEMIGRCIWEIYPEAKGGSFYVHAHRALETQRPQQFEQYYDRWQCWLETRIYPAPDGVSVFRANINERKEQEALVAESDRKLQENEALLRLAIEAAEAGTFDYYPLTRELRLSRRSREFFGLPAEGPVTYESYFDAVHPDDRQVLHATVQRVLQSGGGGRYDLEYRSISGPEGTERWLVEKGRAVTDQAGQATRFIGTILDITEQKSAELVLQQAKQQAEEANRSKDQFLAMLSHELRTPLTPVLMTLASLRRDPTLSDELHRDLAMLQRNVELEALLIDDLLDLTRITHGKLELHSDAVDIHEAIEYALDISAAEWKEKNIKVTCAFAAPLHHCWADGARLQQVFWNLIKNAVKFTPPGGRLEVRTRNDDAHRVLVDVIDTGIGINADLMPRIFEAFEQGGRTTTSHYGGLGLGLAISKRVVDMHGGSIVAASEGPGKGATFTVALQAMETSLLQGPVVYLPEEAKRSGARILLAEDHEDTARVLMRILQNSGYEVAHASGVAAALELAANRRFDLLISDLGLVDGSGLDLMRALQAKNGIRGIALSGFGSDEDVAASSVAGFTEHLTKPVDWAQLSAAIQRLLARQGQVPAEVAAST